MNVQLSEGIYIVAVSGGVDSMVLLHAIFKQFKNNPGYSFVVAHYDHGIRQDSAKDAELVEATAHAYEFTFMTEQAHLGERVSEETARSARYEFLRRIKSAYSARAIVTAHHEDDLLETILLHVARGTGRNGLTPMQAYDDILRPFLKFTKNDIYDYANSQGLTWHEDSTNTDQSYKRNYIRQCLQSNLNDDKRRQLLKMYERMLHVNESANTECLEIFTYVLTNQNDCIRGRFVLLPHQVACEVMLMWLRKTCNLEPTRLLVNRLVIAVKTLEPGKKVDITSGWWLKSEKNVVKISKNT